MKTVPLRFARARAALCILRALLLLAATALGLLTSAALAQTRQTGYLTLDQASGSQWHRVYFPTAFTVTPVVIVGPPSNYDAAASTVRVRNVTTSSFEVQIAEWDYLTDGAHAAEDVSWIALQPGVHNIGGQVWEAGRRTGVTAAPVTVTLTHPYAAPPILLTQVQTASPATAISATNPRGLSARVSGIANTSFQVRITAEQSNTATLSAQTINYLAVQPGTGTVDGFSYVAATSTGVTNAWQALTLGAAHVTSTFFAGVQTIADLDPIALRFRKTIATGSTVEIQLQEEQSADSEVTHGPENVGYLAIARPPGELTSGLEFMTISHTQAVPGQWTRVDFDTPYVNPVVVFGPVQSADAEPVQVRVRGVSATGFEYILQEWPVNDGVHGVEKVSFAVLEQGIHYIAGRRWIAGRRSAVTHVPTSITFSAFNNVPVVLAQVASNAEATPVVERLSNVTTTGFTVQLTEQESDTSGHAGELIHYIVAEPGVARRADNHFLLQALLSPADVTHSFRSLSYTRRIALPNVLGDIQTRNEADPVVPRITSVVESNVSVRAQEETSFDSETSHTAEVFGILAAASILDSDEDGIPDAWETANGLNPNDAADASLDADNDGYQNVLEHRHGTNPNSPDSAGTITITADIPNGFERDHLGNAIGARVRINRAGGTLPATINFTLSGVATNGTDYTPRSTGGTPLTSSISLGWNATATFVVLLPIPDSRNEFPETLTVTLAPTGTGTSGGRYTVGGTSAATVRINDATEHADNEQLFVALLTPTTPISSGSGLGTMYLNGPKTRARVNLTFNGLSSAQTNAYIRYGGDATVGAELRPNLGNGLLQNLTWDIVAQGAYTPQEIIDALYQTAGKWVYSNVGTSNVPGGELAGKWRAESGTINFVPPNEPGAITALSGDALRAEVARFLTQATFGPTKAEIDALYNSVVNTHAGNRIAAFDQWINTQLGYDQTRLLDYAWAADQEEWAIRGTNINTATTYIFSQAASPLHFNRERAWWTIATRARDQLRQRMAFALSEIFVTAAHDVTVRTYHYGHCNYYDMLGSFASGRYRDLLESVSKHPIMGQYLSSLKNQKTVYGPGSDGAMGTADDVALVSPDENYAREIMQLFSIGLVQLHPDGSLKLNATGDVQQTYTNVDITELARVFTGWSFSKLNANAPNRATISDNTNFFFTPNSLQIFHQECFRHPMINFGPAYHDTGAKVVLGQPIAAGLSGEADLDAALDVLHNHANTPPFIARRLIQRLVTSNPSAGYVYRVANAFVDSNGPAAGTVRGDMRAVIKAVLLDWEARTPSVAQDVSFGKQKEPIIRYVQILRAMGGKSERLLSTLSAHGYAASQLDNFPTGTSLYRYSNTNSPLGQSPFFAPSVFNWFLPDYTPGGRIAGAGLVAPEMQITTETAVIAAINYHNQITRSTTGQAVNRLYNAATEQELADALAAALAAEEASAANPSDTALKAAATAARTNYNSLLATANAETVVKLDLTPVIAVYNAASGTAADKVTAALDYLDLILCAGSLKTTYPSTLTGSNPRETMIETIAALSVATVSPALTGTEQLMRELLYLVVTSPSYLHQK